MNKKETNKLVCVRCHRKIRKYYYKRREGPICEPCEQLENEQRRDAYLASDEYDPIGGA